MPIFSEFQNLMQWSCLRSTKLLLFPFFAKTIVGQKNYQMQDKLANSSRTMGTGDGYCIRLTYILDNRYRVHYGLLRELPCNIWWHMEDQCVTGIRILSSVYVLFSPIKRIFYDAIMLPFFARSTLFCDIYSSYSQMKSCSFGIKYKHMLHLYYILYAKM